MVTIFGAVVETVFGAGVGVDTLFKEYAAAGKTGAGAGSVPFGGAFNPV